MPLEDEIKKAFLKVKEDIQNIKNTLENQQKALNSISEELDTLKNITKELQLSMSIGNEGVPQQTTNRQPTDNQQTTNNLSTAHQQPSNSPDNQEPKILTLSNLKKELNSLFSAFTERELQIFLSLYYLEEELKRPVTYPELAKKLKLSQSSVRDHINNLLFKKAPIQKNLSANKNFVSIDCSERYHTHILNVSSGFFKRFEISVRNCKKDSFTKYV